ncbi:MAG: toll/interleukin-1 receptor domain-containing protein [Pseudomonadota bacterium]
MDASAQSPAYRFRAFLSYSRKDDRIAKWLHAALEAYRTPKDLVNTEGRFGAIARRLSPVFRDRTDLSSGGALQGNLVEALKQSEFLVVLCSPASAQSAYVDAEVHAFIEQGRADHIMPVIVSGEPGSGDPATECLPPSLRSMQLLASDLRSIRLPTGQRVGDGREGGKFKLIAGMLGVPLDALLQRERWREAQRGALAVLMSFVFLGLAVTAAGAAYIAYQNEQKARRQTEAAQASADFLVNTFEVANPSTENPETVTARTILDRGAARIRTQFQNQPTTKVRLIDAMGRAYDNLGLIDSSQSLLEAHADVMRRAGADGVPAMVTLAETYRLHSQLERALAASDAALRQARATNADAEAVGLAEETRALVLHDMGRMDESLTTFQSAIAHLERGAAAGRRAHALTNEASVFTDLGRYDEARRALATASAIFAINPGQRSYEFGESLVHLADNDYAAGKNAEAEQYVAHARTILTPILGADNPSVGDVLVLQGQIHTELGRYPEAQSELQAAIALYAAAYHAPHPALGGAHYYLADLYQRQQQYQPALNELTIAQTILTSALGAEHPNVGALLVQKALVLRGLGRRGEAADACAQGLKIIEAGLGASSPMYTQSAQQCAEAAH